MGTYSGEIQALEEKIHIAPSGGEVLLLKKDGDQVEVRDNWALLNRDRLLLKEKNFSLSERGYKINLDDLTKKMEEEQEQLDSRFLEIEEEFKRLNLLKDVDGASSFQEEIDAALEKITLEKVKLETKFHERYSPEKLQFDRDQLHFKMEQQRQELANFRETSYLKAGVSGTIRYLLHKNSYLPGSSEIAEIEAGDPLAIVRNDDTILIYIPESNFDATLLADKNYFARVASESGMRFTAYYFDEFTTISEGKASTFYRFEISKGDLPVAKKTIGESCVLNVLQSFDKPVTVIEKEDLIKEYPSFIKTNGWEAATLKLFPDMKLAGVGKGAIALYPKNE